MCKQDAIVIETLEDTNAKLLEALEGILPYAETWIEKVEPQMAMNADTEALIQARAAIKLAKGDA